MEKLTAKVGPLPAYMWGVLLGGLILIYMWYQRNKANNAAPASTVTTALPNDTGTGLSPASTSTTDTTSGSQWATNALWESQALTMLAGSGVSPLTAQLALENYLNGNPLTTAQQDIVNTVIGKMGPPPNGIAGPPNLLPPPTPTPTPTPPSGGVSITRLPPPVLSVGGISANHVTLHWSAVPGASSYHLHKNGKLIAVMTAGTATVTRPGTYDVSAIPRDTSKNAGSNSNTVTV